MCALKINKYSDYVARLSVFSLSLFFLSRIKWNYLMLNWFWSYCCLWSCSRFKFIYFCGLLSTFCTLEYQLNDGELKHFKTSGSLVQKPILVSNFSTLLKGKLTTSKVVWWKTSKVWLKLNSKIVIESQNFHSTSHIKHSRFLIYFFLNNINHEPKLTTKKHHQIKWEWALYVAQFFFLQNTKISYFYKIKQFFRLIYPHFLPSISSTRKN